MNIRKITVFGAGIWGSVIAQHLAKKGYAVSLWEYNETLLNALKTMGRHPNIPNFKIHDNIRLTGNVADAVENTDLIIFVISSKAIRLFCREQLKPLLNGRVVPVVSASKGIEDKSFKTICEIIEEELPQLKDSVLAFSGPSFALEVAQNVPTKIMLAGANEKLVQEVAQVMSGDPIIVVPAQDRRGVEYGGGIKNVLAIGCGVIDGIGDGANAKAALITQALQEMNDILVSQGGEAGTVYSLAGFGDAILTGMSAISRNRRLGEKLGAGMTLDQAKQAVGTIAEGVNSVQSVYDIARKNHLNTPIIDAIWQIVCQGKKPHVLLHAMGFVNRGNK
ncbi:NAD(P)H-dependent glycerol-3-phosphate dehydrogenase [Candidatus Avelusimicrobium caledoniensis]|uniref:NAD(P)H-dependent glycerol-3-phosphate dehydrogenase n=1 Tax=Candidatus Avelusimicrobium caledoniensis TaxID=3416220 RepID=UPI003D0CB7D0